MRRNSIHNDMTQSVKQRKSLKEKRVEKDVKMKLIFMPEDELSEKEEEDGEEFESGGMYLEKEDVLMIYTAMKHYKPSQEEENLYYVLLESFEEILVVDYHVKLPDMVY